MAEKELMTSLKVLGARVFTKIHENPAFLSPMAYWHYRDGRNEWVLYAIMHEKAYEEHSERQLHAKLHDIAEQEYKSYIQDEAGEYRKAYFYEIGWDTGGWDDGPWDQVQLPFSVYTMPFGTRQADYVFELSKSIAHGAVISKPVDDVEMLTFHDYLVYRPVKQQAIKPVPQSHTPPLSTKEA